jgi:hypothetical protein
LKAVGDLFVTIGANAAPAVEALERVENRFDRLRLASENTSGALDVVSRSSESSLSRMAGSVLKVMTAYRLLTFAVKTYNATSQASQGINPATGTAFGPRASSAIAALNNQLARLGPVGNAATSAIAAGFASLSPVITRVGAVLAALTAAVISFKVAVVASFGLATAAAVGIAGSFKSAALKESIGAVEAIFKDGAKTVMEFADSVQASFGSSKKTILDAATQIGAIMKSQGFSEMQSAKNTVVVMGTAMELAAQRGTTMAQALDAVASAMRGESNPIERLGISINEALVKKTIEGDANLRRLAETNELAAKSAARLMIIQEQSADAFGTMALEAGNLTQQFEKFKGLMGSLFTEFGAGFEPLVTAFFRLVNAVMQLGGMGMPSLASGIDLVLKPLTWFVNLLAKAAEGVNKLLGKTSELPKLGGKLAIPQAQRNAEMEAFEAAQSKFAMEKEYQDRLDGLLEDMAEREKKRQKEIAQLKERQFREFESMVTQQDSLISRRNSIMANMNRSDISSAADVFARNLNAGQEDEQLKELKEINQGIKELGTVTGILN